VRVPGSQEKQEGKKPYSQGSVGVGRAKEGGEGGGGKGRSPGPDGKGYHQRRRPCMIRTKGEIGWGRGPEALGPS